MPQYTCPMHPEVKSDKPGACPICGMALVTHDRGLGPITWKNYLPLITILALITVTAAITSGFSPQGFLISFMTGFFLVFAGFKLMDLGGFAHAYATYDLLAQKWIGYGYLYPFIELAFGLLMLAGFHPPWLLWTEFAVMAFSGLGVAIKLAKHERFSCACLGTFLKIPLTSITLIEDFGMAALALVLLIIT
jgi:hypothetical protein